MRRTLPAVDFAEFHEQIAARSPVPLRTPAVAMLFGHYQTLRIWSARLALIGPGTVEEVLDRHYGESLAALPWLGEEGTGVGRRLVDIGSGAGFPGAVLALARPGLAATLVESRLKKCVFLEASIRAARLECRAQTLPGDREADRALDALSVRVLNARIGRPLPEALSMPIDVITTRAVRLSPSLLAPLIESSPDARYILWLGAESEIPPSLVTFRRRRFEDSRSRFLVEASTKNRTEDTHP